MSPHNEAGPIVGAIEPVKERVQDGQPQSTDATTAKQATPNVDATTAGAPAKVPASAGLLPRATEAGIAMVRQNCPPELLALPAWVCASREPKTMADGSVKSSKRPIDPKNGGDGRSNDATTWGTFDQAAEFALRHGNVFGLGVNLLGSEFVGLDLDHVVSRTTGSVSESAQLLLDALPPTYVEKSPSGDGLRVFLRGAKPASLRGSSWRDAFGPGTALEVYDGTGGARYLTVTGDVLSGEPIAKVCDDDLAALHEWTKPQNAPEPSAVKVANYGSDPQRDLQRAPFALAVLPQSSCDDYHEWRRVGCALKSLGDAGLDLWRKWSQQSAKHQEGDCEKKWNGLHGASFATLTWMANQADPSWRARAADDVRPSPARADRPAADGADSTEEPPEPPSSIATKWGPLARSLREKPVPRRYLLRYPTRDGQPTAPGCGDGFMVRGRVGQLVAAGGAGKSLLLAQLAAACILRRPFLGHFVPDDTTGKVLLAYGEEDGDEVHRRLHAIAEAEGWTDAEVDEVARRLVVLPLSGEPDIGLLRAAKARGRWTETQACSDLIERLHDDAGPDGWALVVLDPLSRFAGVDTSVDVQAGTRIVQVAEKLTGSPGSPAVLFAQHSSKQSRREGTAENRGVTSLSDGVRQELTLVVKEGGGVELRQTKANYCRPMDSAITLEKGTDGVLRVAGAQPEVDPAAERDSHYLRLADASRRLGKPVPKRALALEAGIRAQVGDQLVELAVAKGVLEFVPNGSSTNRGAYAVPELCAVHRAHTPPIPPMGRDGSSRPASRGRRAGRSSRRPGRSGTVGDGSSEDEGRTPAGKRQPARRKRA